MKELIKMNKGEWSEAYTFLKLLADGRIYAADKKLNRIESIYYPLIKIISDEKSGQVEYIRNDNVRVVDSNTGKTLIEISIEELALASNNLLEIIKKGKGTFGNEEIENFLKKIEHKKLKSKSKIKKDITIVIHDIFTGFEPELGFSIKSKLGNPSTLFNASGSTNFIYKIISNNINEEFISKINNIDGTRKIIKRVQNIVKSNVKLKYIRTLNEIFLCNLQIIDSNLPEILSYLLVYCYKFNTSKLTDLLEIIKRENPLKYNLEINENFYKYKIMKFLLDVALGMRPTDIWSGKFDATGGYILVKETGEILCYHIYNINEFQEYLIENTRLETPSSRNNFGVVYKQNEEYFFNLNLQIRFI